MKEIDRSIKLSAKKLTLMDLIAIIFINVGMLLINYVHDIMMINTYLISINVLLIVAFILKCVFSGLLIRSATITLKSDRIYLNHCAANLRLVKPLIGCQYIIIRSCESNFSYVLKVDNQVTSRTDWDLLVSKCSK